MSDNTHVCSACGTAQRSSLVAAVFARAARSMWLMLLFLFLAIPAFLFGPLGMIVWFAAFLFFLFRKLPRKCSACDQTALIPIDSPRAAELLRGQQAKA